MPELPEVETIRRDLEPLRGMVVVSAKLRRRDVLSFHASSARTRSPRPADLLQGCTITQLDRRGKQLAILASPASDQSAKSRTDTTRVLVVQLGMTGRLTVLTNNGREQPLADPHIHAVWQLAPSAANARKERLSTTHTLIFRDPRRFGGLCTLPSLDALHERWSDLGPDALLPDPRDLAEALRSSRRPIKAALLDQRLIAGIGNIYADEALFEAGIRPRRLAATLRAADVHRLATAIAHILAQAVHARGSTLRDYRGADGAPGGFQHAHRVYGRSGEPCLACSRPLRSAQVAQRTTVWCDACQL